MEEEEIQEETTKMKLESIVPIEILAELRESFPIETHETKKMDDGFQQTGVKPAYVTERLNKVLGIEGWEAEEVEIKEHENHIATKVKLTIFITTKTDDTYTKVPIATRTQWGSARIWNKSEYGDVLKSAFTNGLCKAASLFDIAHEAYKGLLAPVESVDDVIDEAAAEEHDKKKNPSKKTTKRTTKKLSAEESAAKPASNETLKVLRKELLGLFTSKGLTRVELQNMMSKNFGKNESRQLTEEELSKLVKIVKELPDESHTEDGKSITEEVAA